jgi:hypothetical protein
MNEQEPGRSTRTRRSFFGADAVLSLLSAPGMATDEKFAAAHDPDALVDRGPEDRRALREVAKAAWQEHGRKSETAQKIYDSHMSYLEERGLR